MNSNSLKILPQTPDPNCLLAQLQLNKDETFSLQFGFSNNKCGRRIPFSRSIHFQNFPSLKPICRHAVSKSAFVQLNQ